VVEAEDGAWQVDTVGRNNLQAPELRCYISTCTYIFKRSQENNEKNAGGSSKMGMRPMG
jgi:hypothetical protein